MITKKNPHYVIETGLDLSPEDITNINLALHHNPGPIIVEGRITYTAFSIAKYIPVRIQPRFEMIPSSNSQEVH